MEDKKTWNLKAKEWHIHVGDEGDDNRRFSSDPIMWRRLGEISGLDILDAGCGTGYLSRKLCSKGARVTGVDYSEEMIKIAEAKSKDCEIKYIVDNCESLESIGDKSIDKLVSNYVLMDVKDIKSAINSFYRVLKDRGIAVLVISHPCFPIEEKDEWQNQGIMTYRWNFCYFDEKRIVEPPWGEFNSSFVYYHRPISHYWRVFKDAGFSIEELDEPSPQQAQDDEENQITKLRMRPHSIIFTLQKM